MEPGEKHEETLVRELWEELGARVSPVKHIWHCIVPERKLTLWGWLARLENEEIKHDPYEVEEPLWMTLEEIEAHPEVMKNTELFVKEIRKALEAGVGVR
jgi:NADH pyrophosphatase NudC (nudix superfamily)